MSFMQPFAEYGTWYVLDGSAGGAVVPVDAPGELPTDPDNPEYVLKENLPELADYYEGSDIWEARVVKGWAARLSAPGYMDCTDWMGPYDSEAKALAELGEFYEICPQTGDPLRTGDAELDVGACNCGDCDA